jgi:phenylacetate-CoA ligase
LDTFEIHYTSEKPLEQAEIKTMEDVFSDYLEPNLIYIFRRKDIMQRGSSGKLKQFISLVK